ncbi:MAG: AsmA family protein, partial [Pseudomonadota bacterium]
MRKTAIALAAFVTLLVVAVFVVPRVINWHRFEHQIADSIREATGREVRIDGEIDVTLLPAITFSVRDVHLANPPGFEAADLASIEEIRGRIQVWPFFGRRIHVDQLVVRGLDVALEVNREGRENWSFEPTAAPPRAEDPKEAEDSGEGLPFADLRLDDVRLIDG